MSYESETITMKWKGYPAIIEALLDLALMASLILQAAYHVIKNTMLGTTAEDTEAEENMKRGKT